MLKTTYVLLSEVTEADINVRDHSDGDPALTGSIGRLGFIDPILRDDRTGRLVDGHGRLNRLREMEHADVRPPTGIQVTAKGWKVPVLTGWASKDDSEAEAAAVALQPKDGRYHQDTLYEVLRRQDDLTGLGFGAAEVADLGRRLQALSDQGPGFPDAGRPEPVPWVSPPKAAPTEPVDTGSTPGLPGPGRRPPPDVAPPVDSDRVVFQLPMTADERRLVVGFVNHAKARAGLDSHAAALVWALERSPASPSLAEDGARRAADTVRSALKALRDGDADRATTIMASLGAIT